MCLHSHQSHTSVAYVKIVTVPVMNVGAFVYTNVLTRYNSHIPLMVT